MLNRALDVDRHLERLRKDGKTGVKHGQGEMWWGVAYLGRSAPMM